MKITFNMFCGKFCDQICKKYLRSAIELGGGICPIGLLGYNGNYSDENRNEWANKYSVEGKPAIGWRDFSFDVNIILNKTTNKKDKDDFLKYIIDYKLMGRKND